MNNAEIRNTWNLSSPFESKMYSSFCTSNMQEKSAQTTMNQSTDELNRQLHETIHKHQQQQEEQVVF